MISGVSIILMSLLLYVPYYKDLTIFTNIFWQVNLYSQSFLALIEFFLPKLENLLHIIIIFTFIALYIGIIVKMLFKKHLNLNEILQSYTFVMLVYIFLLSTNFRHWYILWLIPTMCYQTRKMRMFLLVLTYTVFLPLIVYFMFESDIAVLGIGYSVCAFCIAYLFFERGNKIGNKNIKN